MLPDIFSIFKRVKGDLLGINERNFRYIYPLNAHKYHKYADDKIITKQVLESHGLACPKTYAAISQIGEIESTWSGMKANQSMVIKPSMGRGGDGIKLIRQSGQIWIFGKEEVSEDKIFIHIANTLFGMFSYGKSDRVLIEELIEPDSFFTDIYPDGVADIRIILLHNKPVMAMLRLPTDESDGKANLHQGGLGVGVEMETGKLTHVYDGRQFVLSHPDSHVPIPGLKLPYWSEILDLSQRVSEVFPLGFLGVDIVIDRVKGPMVLEINIRPGLSIQMANRKGLKEVLTGLSRQLGSGSC